MANYIINTGKTDGKYHEMHKTTCNHLPYSWNQKDLGYHSSDVKALEYAKSIGYSDADGCAHCCSSVHHG